jgi:hypothetical protein
MTSYRFRYRNPTPAARDRFRFVSAPRAIYSDFGPAFGGGHFREVIRSTHQADTEVLDGPPSKPRVR